MEEVRCTKCNKLLYKISNYIEPKPNGPLILKELKYNEMKVEIMCPRCKTINK